jgi:putative redox protein
MKNTVKWIKNMTMLAQSASGHALVMDGPGELGGENLGVRPMEMLLLGMGGCMTVDVVSTLKKMREIVLDCEVEIEAERATEHPKTFTTIHLHFTLKGVDLNAKKIKKAIDLSAEKYCSASIMLGKSAKISHNFEIHE